MESLVLVAVLLIGVFGWVYWRAIPYANANFVEPRGEMGKIGEDLTAKGFDRLANATLDLPREIASHPFMARLEARFGQIGIWRGASGGHDLHLFWKSYPPISGAVGLEVPLASGPVGRITIIANCFSCDPVELPNYEVVPEMNAFGMFSRAEDFNESYDYDPKEETIRALLKQPEIYDWFGKNKGWLFSKAGDRCFVGQYYGGYPGVDAILVTIEQSNQLYEKMRKNWALVKRS